MTALSVINEIWNKSAVFGSEKDINFNIFQNITCAKLVLIHEKIPNIITNMITIIIIIIIVDIKFVLRIG